MLDDVEPDEVLIAIPSAPGTLRARVVSACRARGVPVRTMPTVFELLQNGSQLVRQVREVRVEDVLGREPVRMETELTGGYLTGRCVLVTGAGGSIGAELCRQISRVGPSALILLDHAEDNLFEIERELRDDRHARNTVAVLADCKEEERMREVFAEYRPTVVFHAAAFKHVGLMETNPVEAVRNNALATRVMARVAGDVGVKVFVLVSTDKAVAPATVMGASKALAEWAVEAADRRYPDTAFTAVRFGNVLGSSGSVVPIFRRQIAAGGPVTVTDPEMTRFFMTIPEAVQLVMRSGSLAQGGEVFVLEMGDPVKIMDLARDMIRFSKLEPDKDIAIEIVGPRPGEKLHEELFNPYERPEPTPAAKILRAARPAVDPAWVAGDVRRDLAARAGGRRGRRWPRRWPSWPPPGPRWRSPRRPLRSRSRATAPGPRRPRRRLAAGWPPRIDAFGSMDLILAFSLQDQVEKYGAYVGLAAFIGLAVLTLLYFAQARELKRLRDWAGRAPERAAELQERVVAQAEAALQAPEVEPAVERSGTVGPAQPVAQPAARQRPAPAPIPMGPRPAVAMAAAAARAAAAPATVEHEAAGAEEPGDRGRRRRRRGRRCRRSTTQAAVVPPPADAPAAGRA